MCLGQGYATLVYKTLFLLRGTPHLLDESSWGFAVHFWKVNFLFAMCTEEGFLEYSSFRQVESEPKDWMGISWRPCTAMHPRNSLGYFGILWASLLVTFSVWRTNIGWCQSVTRIRHRIPGVARKVLSSFLRAVWRLGSGTRRMVSASPTVLDSLAFSLFRSHDPVPCPRNAGLWSRLIKYVDFASRKNMFSFSA